MEEATEKKSLNGASERIITNQCLPSERLPEGKLQFGDSIPGIDLEKLPIWFNLELAQKGQKFARERLYGVFYSHLIALFFLLAQRDARKILYYTQKSHTPDLALRRYLATLLQVKLWYDADISDDTSCPFFTSLANVKKIHHAMGQRVQAQHPDFSKPVVEEPKGRDEGSAAQRGKLWEAFKADLESSELAQHVLTLQENPTGFYYFSQFDMTLTQWSFVALPIMYSQTVGMYDVTDEELEGFIHLWAIIGHTLGLDPRYNICLVPDLKSFKVHAKWIYENQYLPGFLDVSYESEVMWCALAEGVSNIFPFLNVENLLLQTLEDFIAVPCHNFRQQISWTSFFRRIFQKSVVEPLLNFKWFQQYCNNYVRETVAKVTESLLHMDSRNDVEISQKAYF